MFLRSGDRLIPSEILVRFGKCGVGGFCRRKQRVVAGFLHAAAQWHGRSCARRQTRPFAMPAEMWRPMVRSGTFAAYAWLTGIHSFQFAANPGFAAAESHSKVLTPFRQSDGSYRIGATFRCLITRA